MQEFWTDCGHRLLTRNDHGWLRVTPEWLRHLLARPELAPIESSGPGERAFLDTLGADPLWPGADAALHTIEDADTRENVAHFLRWRRALLDAVTLERFYLQQFRHGAIDLPPVFLDWVAQAIVRDLLEGSDDPFQVRAGELFFRRQRISTEGGRVLAADAETIQLFAETGGFGNLGRLLQQQGTSLRGVSMDVLTQENAAFYWFAESRYRFVLDLTAGSAGSMALAMLLGRWVQHFLGTAVDVENLARIDDDAWRWHVGLDAESTAILNDLYRGASVEEARLQRLACLFRLRFRDPGDMLPDTAGKPVYLGLAMNAEHTLKLKPQNLLLNLPLARNA